MEEQESSLTFNSAASHHVLDMIDHRRSQPLLLSFNNLSYQVKIRRKTLLGAPTERLLLDDISGEAREGEITAVLGASGSGKSTLLDALANRIAKESLKGTVKLNGEALESRLSAYVMQDDLLYPMLTVEETLMFAAQFRLPRTLSHSKKKLRVQALIDQLGLRSAAKTVIGNEGRRGVSGGERRRVSIGIDIIHGPLVLFLDEPTSGLDSTSAFMVVKVLQRIAQSGSIVIMSVHQPSYRILGLLDRLIFLSSGQTVYSGLPASLSDFFDEFGRPVPENENHAEFGLDLIAELEQSPGGTKSLVEFNKTWQNMMMKNSQNDTVAIGKAELNQPVSTKVIDIGPHFVNPFWVEVAVLSKRSMLNSWRMPEIFGIRLGAIILAGIIMGSVFWRLDDTPSGVRERLGIIAFSMSTTFFICADAIPAFVEERFMFLRETSHNAYRRWVYVLANSLVSIPAFIVLSLAFAGVTHWAVGLAGGFMFYSWVILASFWAGSSFVTFLSGVIPHIMLGYTTAISLLSYFILFSGYFITHDRIPNYWLWLHYISLVKYPYEAVMQNEFQSSTKCFVRGVQLFDNSPLAMVADPLKLKMLDQMSNTLGMSLNGSTCLTTGADVLRQQGITEISKWSCLWITVACGFFYRILFYFALLLGGRNKRR